MVMWICGVLNLLWWILSPRKRVFLCLMNSGLLGSLMPFSRSSQKYLQIDFALTSKFLLAKFNRPSLKIDTFLIMLLVPMIFFATFHGSNIEAVLLKLDFGKAFDLMNWDFLFELLLARGFGHWWIGWIKACLLFGTSSTLVNRKLGKYIQCRRELRQGDTLSPYRFILVADSLTKILSLVGKNGSIQKVSTFPWPNDLMGLHYADDTLLLVSGDARSLTYLKVLLYTFEMALGLKINFHKSFVLQFV